LLKMDAQRALLDSLMGLHRNQGPDEENPQERISWKDSEVCKHFLVAFCPYLQFDDTRADIGPCHRKHEEYFRMTYNREAKERTKAKYERRLLKLLRDMIVQLDSKIARDKERLGVEEQEKKAEAEAPIAPVLPQRAEKVFSSAQKERLDSIDEEIREKQLSMEHFGNEGRVEEAQELLAEVEFLRREKEIIHDKARKQAGWTTTEQSRFLRVCEVCGAYLGLNKNRQQQHTDNHWQGRLHAGYALVRETVVELEEKAKVRKENIKDTKSESEDDSRERERIRRRKRSRSSSRWRKRSRSSSRRRRSISSSRRKKYRRRGRSGSRGHRR